MAKWDLSKLDKDDREIDPSHIIERLDVILDNLDCLEFDVRKALEDLRLFYVRHSAGNQFRDSLNEKIKNEQSATFVPLPDRYRKF